ncbi:hypothetical protein E1212_06515 [Jiangella ureilytica]|uniref:J domain-containing protein n=1 Tax=Jiangella ureilytica TaxID=2530374 RepID=A0A4R4RUQ5_9ACTN|nr:J domain-containing protein [Jiangella ureilytica]TDC53069.1 hypothetical protein E1212_06515 [Jiangella ureilytica]
MTADLRALGGADPHDVLGVRRGASPQQVTRAFHREALRGGHPDTGGDARAFRRLVVARDALLTTPDPGPVQAPGPSARPGPSAPPSASPGTTARPAPPPASADTNVLPLIVLLILFLVGVPHVLLALVIMLVP